jgi:hypothetical protein
VARRELSRCREDARSLGDVTKREELGDRFDREVAREVGEGQKGAQLGTEGEPRVLRPVVERLDPDPVAGDEEPLPVGVPDGEREHAAEPVDHLLPVVLVQVDEGFGVAARAKPVAPALQLRAERVVVVDLAVEDDHDRAVLVGDRLVPAGHVDDAEPAHADRDARADVAPFVVGPAMKDGAAHGAKSRVGQSRIAHLTGEPSDPAHRRSSAA